jgi:hypothetical protein
MIKANAASMAPVYTASSVPRETRGNSASTFCIVVQMAS